LNPLRRFWRRTRPVQTLPVGQAYALWAANYPPHAHNALMQVEQAAVLDLLPSLSGKSVLDLACGTGRYSRVAQERGAAQVVGADDSLAMLRAGGGRATVLAPMEALPFKSACFDVVICGLATGHLLPNRLRPAIREMGRVLRPGGTLLISDFHPYLFWIGGQRAFTAPDGRRYAVEHHPHLVADYFGALAGAGLALTGLAEPVVAIGKRDHGRGVPAVLVLRAQRLMR